ncbi:hypothetical protein I6H07_14410 [Hafnia alvei]|uniref:hypothetical protein n=1 Tax=Hafnia alvei TaxID=569 RepID=UPI000B6B1F1F|nr:hypothetical protein [Hafnia alvei]MBI0276970.1 hypothetical protein [Hafnia alvei]PNK99999.1 hypothetical protein CEQ28_021655 [Hafnia alvei]
MSHIKYVMFPILAAFPLFANAIEPDTSSPIEHQKCGKNINLTLRNVADGHAVIGLINRKTKAWDYFYSHNGFVSDYKYSQYVPAIHNAKSDSYELAKETANSGPAIYWGVDKTGNYQLALGKHSYRCGPLMAPETNPAHVNDNLNAAYGE